ncbi:MAG: ATP phosphoribosyltransferase regulatory subunit, partial [Phycisphaerae bacterium]|nr:ATP phosphoribosyltransferase regulatory subunit [Phycisphaerae bacterium]
MKIQGVKGTRDFYPDDMRLRNWITDTWRAVSLRNGFEQYDSPIFEYLDLFTIKSGEAIAAELFSFTDRAGRSLAIRPETTPALARMVNARINSLPRPIKWFTIQRCCRAENPQRGRLREFFCWNIDIIGSDSPTADAECVFVATDALTELGLTPKDVTIRYSSRALTGALLRTLDSGCKDTEAIFAVLDKRPKVDPEGFDRMLKGVIPNDDDRMKLLRFLDMRQTDATVADSIAKNVGVTVTQDMISAQANLQQFQRALDGLGVGQWCEYDTNIVRGLAYYTGIVYEIFGRDESLRTVAGGGRYDDLLGVLGGPQVGATGFGMGDVVLGLLLQQKGKAPELTGA